jgi:hypothetical protein
MGILRILRRIQLDSRNKVEWCDQCDQPVFEKDSVEEANRRVELETMHIKEAHDKIMQLFNKDECIEYKGVVTKNGYGRICIKGIRIQAHVLSYILHHGSVPRTKYVLHKCDNRLCINPDHLFLGSKADNVKDMVNKGRAWWQRPFEEMPENMKRLIKKRRKLSSQQIKELKEMHSNGISQRSLSRYFNVGQPVIKDILDGRTYKDV